MNTANATLPVKYILTLRPNGDPYGHGFTATETRDDPDATMTWYRSDLGAMSRAGWRQYARRNGYILREWRD